MLDYSAAASCWISEAVELLGKYVFYTIYYCYAVMYSFL